MGVLEEVIPSPLAPIPAPPSLSKHPNITHTYTDSA